VHLQKPNRAPFRLTGNVKTELVGGYHTEIFFHENLVFYLFAEYINIFYFIRSNIHFVFWWVFNLPFQSHIPLDGKLVGTGTKQDFFLWESRILYLLFYVDKMGRFQDSDMTSLMNFRLENF
jgi:hypothetical protein